MLAISTSPGIFRIFFSIYLDRHCHLGFFFTRQFHAIFRRPCQCYQIDFVLDLHGHTTSNGSFIYGNTYDNVFRYERHLVFPKLLSANAPDFASEHMMFNADERKHGSLRRFCCETLTDSVNAYTLEISMGGYQLKGAQDTVQYTEEDCTEMMSFCLIFLQLQCSTA